MNKQQSLWNDEEENILKDKISTAQRDATIKTLMIDFFEKAKKEDYIKLDLSTHEMLKKVFYSDIWGFREILLVIVIGRLLNDKYRASVDLYECRPRALFEGPIRSVLREYSIPHRQSGPLNVAKGTKMINSQWALGRRPRDIAEIIVQLVTKLEDMQREDLINFAINIHAYFLQQKKEVEALAIEIQPEADPDHIYRICERLINEVPDAGNTPQKIVGLLLEAYHDTLQTGLMITGHNNRASVTSTTSKKLGDISEEKNGHIFLAYEVTVKPFEGERVIDAYNAARAFDKVTGKKTNELIVLCREGDCHPDIVVDTDTIMYFGKILYKDLTFYFQNIYEWIMAQLLRMPEQARLKFFTKLHEYIDHPNTSLAVKKLWKELNE